MPEQHQPAAERFQVSPPRADAGPDRQRIREIHERAEKATPGPWRVDDPSWIEVNDITVWCGPEGDDARWICNMGAPIAAVDDRQQAEVSYANGTFVAHAREDVPWLLAQLSAARAEAQEAREAIQIADILACAGRVKP